MNVNNNLDNISNASRHTAIFEKELVITAEYLGIDKDKLHMWLNQYPLAQDLTLLSFLHLIKKYDLDPFADELTIIKNADGSTQAFITVDGWSKIINQHAQFAGMSLRESTEEKNGVSIWMECSIYRNDRILPIVVKEYFDEVKTEHISWENMPRRMLRHRVIQQCARIAFGVSAPEINAKRNIPNITEGNKKSTLNLSKMTNANLSQTERLKKKLAT
jgi:hypothetical protein